MLVAIAGTVGVGKSTIAKWVAAELEIPFHSIDDDKLAVGQDEPEFRNWIESATPFPDEFRHRVFARTLDALEELATGSAHVIVEETFHRKSVREPFFLRAATLLGGFKLIHITANRDAIIDHLATRRANESDHMAGEAMYEAFQTVSDPFESVDLTVVNDGRVEEAVATVCAFLLGADGLEGHNHEPQ